ncbi:MAG: gluconate 2-dehydrogenase subunit 3 family protein [Saprospiraceae bacterium]|nr:gluconate 2-dehydrogenase subunit 3 family protein [Saprospiraceae bacterium]
MDRRDTIKSILLGGVAGGLVLNGCKTEPAEKEKPADNVNAEAGGGYGRTPEEMARDKALKAEKFFTEHEMATITVLSNIILPADADSGSASDAEVPAFMEFIVKDMPHHQVPLRGGLMWLDHEANARFGKSFADCSSTQQLEIVEDIAYADKVKPEYSQGAKFFSHMRDLTMTGFYTTKIGLDDLGYVGNVPNVWDGVPDEELKKHDLEYGEFWMSRCINQEDRGKEPVWDQLGNLIG